jgi:hypothetical protein
MGVKHVEAFGGLLLVVQQIAGTFQCLDGSLNAYLDKCLEIIALFNYFTMQHVSRDGNTAVNDLVQQASDFRSNRGKFDFLEKPGSPIFGRCAVRQFVLLDQVQQNRTVLFLKSEGPKFPRPRTNQAEQRRSILMIGGHPWYVI